MTEHQNEPDQVQLFVIRLWLERFNDGQQVWRGEIVHANRREKRYFARWVDLLKFLCKVIGVEWEARLDREIKTEVVDRKLD